MREIKFRAWDKSKEVLVDAELILGIRFDRKHQEPALIAYTQKLKPSMEISDLDKIFCNEFELMQYTGLKDREGTEVYEGDILVRDDFAPRYDYYVVKFGEYQESPCYYHVLPELGYYIEGKNERNQYRNGIRYVIESLECKVAGNIYQNPELMEGME